MLMLAKSWRGWLLSLLIAAPLAQAAPLRVGPVEAELVAENTSLVPGRVPNWLGLRLKPDPGWHVYWRNPGDSGIATKLEWQLPAGVSAGDIQWPYPQVFRLGALANYGYGEDTLQPIALSVAAGTQGPLTLQATAKWLVCKDVCIPGKTELRLQLPVATSSSADPRQRAAFARARARLPQTSDWPAQYAISKGRFSLAVQATQLKGASVAFYPYASDLINHAAAQQRVNDNGELRLSQQLNPYFVQAPKQVDGVLVLTTAGDSRAYEIHASAGTVAPVTGNGTSDAISDGASVAAAPVGIADLKPQAPRGLATIFLLALLGGLVLNLMPCVFPVLSLKALSIARAGAAGQRRQALAYSAGVIGSCVLAAVAILLLRGAGEAVGWGFQLQSPTFVAALAYLMFALGLSMSGLVEFGTGLMNLGQGLTERKGSAGAFFTGVLAVVVASPCTAPFMGTAIGYAMTQPPLLAVAVFAALGLGLALPFLVIGFVPAAARLLPKPGAWMEKFKQAMAFPLYLTVVWLLWVLARQLDINAAALVMIGLVLIAFTLWLWTSRGLLTSLLKLVAVAGAIALIVLLPQAPQAASAVRSSVSDEQTWSEQRVAQLRAEGRTVFVDFTADWCLTCKVNEQAALKTERVQQVFRERGVVSLVADWTRADPAITAELARFQRNGVPLYVVYPHGGEAKILPQLLTPDLVIAAIP